MTNQSGVDRGYFNLKDVIKLHKWVNYTLKKTTQKLINFMLVLFILSFQKINLMHI